jgi:hypothetical protein
VDRSLRSHGVVFRPFFQICLPVIALTAGYAIGGGAQFLRQIFEIDFLCRRHYRGAPAYIF